jgi:hypothetical protein
MTDAQVEIYIDCGEATENKRAFDALRKQTESIEDEFGGELEWQRLDDRRACRIRHRIRGHGLLDRDHWANLQDEMCDAMTRLHKALQPKIEGVAVQVRPDLVARRR